MAMTDPEQERRRLAEVYSRQTDGELEAVAKQAYELTEIARQTLRAELLNRGLSAETLDQSKDPGSEEPEFRDLVTVRSFWGLSEAELAKGLLDAAGIESFLFDDNMVRMNWFNANALGGVKLRVDAENVQAADEILQEQESASEDIASDESELPT
jgi:putative signal transducing protein